MLSTQTDHADQPAAPMLPLPYMLQALPIQPYAGQPGQAFEIFERNFELLVAITKMPDELAHIHLSQLLVGKAREFHHTLTSQDLNYQELRTVLKKRFIETTDPIRAFKDLANISQDHFESVRDYECRFRAALATAQQGQPHPFPSLALFVAGLHPSLAAHVQRRNPKDFEEAIAAAKVEEKLVSSSELKQLQDELQLLRSEVNLLKQEAAKTQHFPVYFQSQASRGQTNCQPKPRSAAYRIENFNLQRNVMGQPRRRLQVSIRINGRDMRFMVDTGCSNTIIKASTYHKYFRSTPLERDDSFFWQCNKTKIQTNGVLPCKMSLKLDGEVKFLNHQKIFVADLSIPGCDGLLGFDSFCEFGLMIGANQCLRFDRNHRRPPCYARTILSTPPPVKPSARKRKRGNSKAKKKSDSQINLITSPPNEEMPVVRSKERRETRLDETKPVKQKFSNSPKIYVKHRETEAITEPVSSCSSKPCVLGTSERYDVSKEENLVVPSFATEQPASIAEVTTIWECPLPQELLPPDPLSIELTTT